MHVLCTLFCTLYYKRISLWKLHGLWKLQFKNCFRIDRFAVLGPQECLEFVCRILWTVRSQGELCFVFGSICAIIGLFVLRGELCFVFGSSCAIIGLFRSQGRTLLRVWIDLCDYWTVPFSGENFASCLDRFVRLLTAVRSQGRTLLRIWIDCVNIDNYLVLRENTASSFALDFV